MKALTMVAVTMSCCAPAASASPQTLASVTVRAPIAAYGGWVLWSTPVNGGWGLDAYHAGEVRTLRVAPRPQPFDVDLGTNAAGGVVATFSRCMRTPGYVEELFQELNGAGCRVHVLNLASERESAPTIPHPADTSDTMPSMWNGNIAFARFDPRHHADITQLLLWSGRTHKLRVLRHGAAPTTCPASVEGSGQLIHTGKEECAKARFKGVIEGIDLGPRLVAFLWKIDGPGVIGTGGGWEVRADRLPTGESILVGSGFRGDVCMDDTIDGSVPSSPFVEAGQVWYTQLNSVCYVNTISVKRFDAGAHRLYSAPVEGEVLQIVRSGSALYALVAPRPKGEFNPTCTTAEPCSIERLQAPAFKLVPGLPHSPFS